MNTTRPARLRRAAWAERGQRQAALRDRNRRSGPRLCLPTEHLPARYEPLEHVAQGGVGCVYRAWDRESETVVVVKVLSEGEPLDGWKARHLRREGEVASAWDHPSLMRVLERGDVAGRPYLVFSDLLGESLRDSLTAGSLFLPTLVRALLQVSEGLAYLHARGWVHGDIKPGNILFDQDGHAHLIDFGLTGPAGPPVREGGQVIASLEYAAPEQASGQVVLPASDVYSLCVVLCEAATGTRPSASEVQPAQVAGESGLEAWVERVGADLPGSIQKLIARGLQPAPSGRYPDGAALAAALSCCLQAGLPWLPVGAAAQPAWMEAPTAPPPLPRAA